MGRGLPRFQARTMAPQWEIHDQVGVHIPGVQRRPSPVPREGCCPSADEVGRFLHHPAFSRESSGRTSCRAKVRDDVAHEARSQGHSRLALNNHDHFDSFRAKSHRSCPPIIYF